MTQSHIVYRRIDSPIGPLLLAGRLGTLHAIRFAAQDGGRPEADWVPDDRALPEAVRQLGQYFAGQRRSFALDLHLEGTAFQVAVWRALADIPFAETCAYGELAARLGRPGASRAVGAANGANPLPIVLPCHRVIGADGSLTGFGGGLELKRALLAHERRVAGSPLFGQALSARSTPLAG